MIRRLDETYKTHIRSLWERTFTEDGPAFVDHYFDVYTSMDQVIGDVEDDELRCMLHLNPYQVMWQGSLYDTSYVVGVATDEAHRRKGYMRKMLQWVLKERYDAGEVFSLLMPINSKYYDQFGFGFVQDVMLYKFKYESLGRDNRSVPYKLIKKGEGIELLNLYNQYKRQFTLQNNRGMHAFEVLLSEVSSEKGQVALVPDGYVIYYPEGETVFVREAVYTTMDGLNNIIDYLGEATGGKVLEWQMPFDSPLEMIVPHMEGTVRVKKPFMMVRIIQVKTFLGDMAMLIGDMVIKVTDNILLENNQTYNISGGQVTTIEKEPDLTIDVESLAQWLFGYESLEALAFVRSSVVLNNNNIYYPEQPIVNYFNEFV